MAPFLSALTLAWGAAAAAPTELAIDPAFPAWVAPQPFPLDTVEGERSDVQWLLSDQQLRVADGSQEVHHRFVERVATIAGVHDASDLSYVWDPAYERLTLHHIHLVRDGRVLDALDPDALRVVDQEPDGDRRIYNGERAALAFLRDVRVGDLIDTAWTVSGANPALGGKFAGALTFGFGVPVGRLHRSLLWPSDRALHSRALGGAQAPVRLARDGVDVLDWTLEPSPGQPGAPRTPGWHEDTPWVQLSEFATWADVVAWASPNFATEAPTGALADEVARIRAEAGSEEARARAAVQLVQDQVRYLGMEMGPRGLVPHPAHVTWSQRFGDCKDKALLLVTLLRALDVDAAPALVNTRRRGGVADFHPTPYAFDHAIVRARVDGREVWLDGTRALERGPLAALPSPNVGVALVLEPGSTGLVDVPAPAEPVPEREVHERWVLTALDGPLELVVTTTARGHAAAATRWRFEGDGARELTEQDLAFYQRRFPTMRSTAPVELVDDPATGATRTVERYVVDHVWDHDGGLSLDLWLPYDELELPPPGERTAPLAIDHPDHVRQVIELELPLSPWQALPGLGPLLPDVHERAESAAMSYEMEGVLSGRVLTVTGTYRTTADAVSPAQLAAHRDAVDTARGSSAYHVSREELVGSEEGRQGALGIVAVVAVLGGGSAVGFGRRLWERRGVRRRLGADEGKSPDRPFTVRDSAEALRVLGDDRCACGAALDTSRRESTTSRHGGRHLLELQVGCTRCDRRNARWFVFRIG